MKIGKLRGSIPVYTYVCYRVKNLFLSGWEIIFQWEGMKFYINILLKFLL